MFYGVFGWGCKGGRDRWGGRGVNHKTLLPLPERAIALRRAGAEEALKLLLSSCKTRRGRRKRRRSGALEMILLELSIPARQKEAIVVSCLWTAITYARGTRQPRAIGEAVSISGSPSSSSQGLVSPMLAFCLAMTLALLALSCEFEMSFKFSISFEKSERSYESSSRFRTCAPRPSVFLLARSWALLRSITSSLSTMKEWMK